MAYLEELLPAFRNGAKIRRKSWPENLCISFRGSSGINIALYDVEADDWEKVPDKSIDWNYIIKNKCLCWFWDHSEERKRTGLLARLISQDEYRFEKGVYNGEPSIPYMNCRPVCKDEVTFYEDKRDD